MIFLRNVLLVWENYAIILYKLLNQSILVNMKKAMIAPIIFAVLTMLCIVGYAALFLWIPIPIFFKVVIAVVVLSLIIAMGYVVAERNRELKEEEDYDPSEY